MIANARRPSMGSFFAGGAARGASVRRGWAATGEDHLHARRSFISPGKDHGSRQSIGPGQADVARRRPDQELELPALGDPPMTGRIIEGERVRTQRHRHRALLSGLERDLSERLQLLGWPGERGRHIVDIELDGLAPRSESPTFATSTCTVTGVAAASLPPVIRRFEYSKRV